MLDRGEHGDPPVVDPDHVRREPPGKGDDDRGVEDKYGDVGGHARTSELLGPHERDDEIAEDRQRDRTADQVLDHIGSSSDPLEPTHQEAEEHEPPGPDQHVEYVGHVASPPCRLR